MIKKIILLFLSSIFLLFSCKKKDSSIGLRTNTSTPAPYGEMTSLRSVYVMSGTLTNESNTGYADFRADINTTTRMPIGGLMGNGTKFKLRTSDNMYWDTTGTMSLFPTTWEVSGAGSIPSFTYTNNDSIPKYTGYALIPDTIDRNQSQTLQVNGVSGADAIEVSFFNTNGTANNLYQYRSTGISTNNTFSCPAGAIAALPLTTPSSLTIIIISVFKHNTQTINGVQFSFVSQFEVNKIVYIK
ncbi:MAG: hypothetical protein ACXVC6_10590 [Bacteroidia bacterium]